MIIGTPVSNCNQASGGSQNESIKSTVGGTYELGHSFSVEVTAGIEADLGVASVSVSTTVGQSVEETKTQSHSVEITIPPGQIVSLARSDTATV